MQTQFDADQDGVTILTRLATVLDPELDESIIKLGFVHALQVRDKHAYVTLELPTSWCAVNFAFLMAEDVRKVLSAVDGIDHVTIRLGDHCAAPEIEAAVNQGKPFSAAFPGEAGAGLAALRALFLRKGFLIRQERLLGELRASGRSAHAICALCVGDGSGLTDAGVVRRYLERRVELGLDCSPAAPLIVDHSGVAIVADRLEAHYQQIRTVRVSMEANGSFCRAVLATRAPTMLSKITNGGEIAHV
jgi:metal-sulfur cluster biosynthetic enzyme